MRSSQGSTKHAEIEERHNDGSCSPRSSPAPSYNSQHPMRQLQSRKAGLRQTLEGRDQDLLKQNLNAGANYQQHRRSGDFSIGVDTKEHPANTLSGNGKSGDADVQINS